MAPRSAYNAPCLKCRWAALKRLKGAQDFRSFVRLSAEQIYLAQQIERMGIPRFEFKSTPEHCSSLRVLALLHIDLAPVPTGCPRVGCLI